MLRPTAQGETPRPAIPVSPAHSAMCTGTARQRARALSHGIAPAPATRPTRLTSVQDHIAAHLEAEIDQASGPGGPDTNQTLFDFQGRALASIGIFQDPVKICAHYNPYNVPCVLMASPRSIRAAR